MAAAGVAAAAGAAAPSIAAQRQVKIAIERAVQAPAQDGTAPSGGGAGILLGHRTLLQRAVLVPATKG